MKRHFPWRLFLLTTAVVLILVLTVLFLGQWIGLKRPISYWVALAVVGLWIVFCIVLLARRGRSTATGRRVPSPSAIPATELFGATAVGERLNRTIEWLKNSKLAEMRKDPVYSLPWYLFLGLPGSGKSTLIVQSGFSFSYTEPKKPLGRPNVGPTEGCDFWIANEAVFIDPSGRYFAEDGIQDGWTGVLYQIRQQRKARPADGIVLVIDLDSLLASGPEAARVQAERTRSFLDMTARAFGMVLPVYLVFAKADLIEGFEEFFADAGNGGAAPLGATFRQEQYQKIRIVEEFRAEFDELYRSLLPRRAALLGGAGGRTQEKVLAYPAQLPLVRERLCEFVEVLFQINQFREQPLFRGFYFASSVQTGRPRSPIAELLAAKAGLPKAPDQASPQQTQNYFVHPLFTRVIIPDRGLAGLSREVRKRRLRLRMAAWGAVGILFPILLLGLVWSSYRDSSELITATAAAEQISPKDGKTAENLSALLALQERLQVYECRPRTGQCRHGGRRLHWGLRPSEAALAAARTVYIEKARALFLDPLFNADTRLGQKYNGLKTQLDLIAAPPQPAVAIQSKAPSQPQPQPQPQPQFDPGRTYNLLKTFLMFSSEAKASPAFLQDQIQDYWCQGVPDQKRDQAVAVLTFYLHQLGDHQNTAYRLTRSNADNETIERLRKLLLVVEPDRYYYEIIREEGKRKVDSVSMSGVLGNKALQVFESDSPVDGPYTRVGWDTFVRDRISAMKADYEEERSWVLGTPVASPGELKIDEKLRAYYFRDYQQGWWTFLKSIRVKHFGNLQDASQKLAVLTDAQQAPVAVLFDTVSLNTWNDLEKLKVADVKQLETLDGAGGMRFGVSNSFQSIHSLTAARENQDAALTQYTKALSRLLVAIRTFIDANQPAGQIPDISREADAALQTTNGLLVNLDANSREAVEPLLKQPIQEVIAILGKATPLGIVVDVRQRGLTLGGTLQERGKKLQGATVLLMEPYSESKFLAGKEITRAQTQDGTFRFTSPVNPGSFKICASRKGESGYYCGDVRVDRGLNGRTFVLKHPRSMVVFGGGQLEVVLQIQ